MKTCGIYKITSPTGRIYIGQSTQIEFRWIQYKYYERQNESILINNSIKKHGYENHIFEIIEICEKQNLDEKEIYWIDFYKSNYKKYPELKGMNLTEGGNKPPSNLGRLKTQKEKELISIKNKNNFAKKRVKDIKQYDLQGNLIKNWENVYDFNKKSEFKYREVLRCCKGEKFTYLKYVWRFKEDDFEKFPTCKPKPIKKQKIVKEKLPKKTNKPRLGFKISEETKKKMSISHQKRWTNELKLYYSNKFKGRKNYWKSKKQTLEEVEKRISKKRKPILQYDLEGNFIREWRSAKDVEVEMGWNCDYISLCARGKILKFKNYIWKYKNGITKEVL